MPELVKSIVPVAPSKLKFVTVVCVPPKLIESSPKVIDEFANEPFAMFVKVLSGPLIVLFVSVSVDVSVTIEPSVAKVISLPETLVVIPEPPVNKIPPPNEIVCAELSSPVIVIDELAKFAFVIPAEPDKFVFEIFVTVLSGAFIVLFVNVSEPVKETKVASETAVLNSASVPVIVLSVKSIDLFVSVAVPEAVISEAVSAAIVKVLPDKVEVMAVPPKTLSVSPFAEIVATVELSSAILIVPSTVLSRHQ